MIITQLPKVKAKLTIMIIITIIIIHNNNNNKSDSNNYNINNINFAIISFHLFVHPKSALDLHKWERFIT